MDRSRSATTVIALAVGYFGVIDPSAAQQGEARAAAGSGELEEVVVTARRREENIQNVPVAVTAISGADLNQAFTLDTTGLQHFSPNVVFDTIEMGTPGGGGFSIRGIGYQDVDKGFDPTVLVALDDVPLATGTGQVFDLIDIESIEVLRGPQGTLFGKNVVGGLINIHRVAPKLNQTSSKIRVRAGDFEKYSGDVLFNYGKENWAVKLTGGLERQDKGYVDNLGGGTLWDRDNDRFGAHVLWQPSDTFKAELMYDYSKLDGTSNVFLTDINESDLFCYLTGILDEFGGAPLGVPSIPPGGGVYCSGKGGQPATHNWDKTAANYPMTNELEKNAVTARLTANVTDDYTVTYIGSWMRSTDDQSLDGDGTLYPIYEFRRWGDYEQVTNEVRLSRDQGSIFTWQAGFFQAWAEGTNNQDTTLTLLGCNLGGDPCTFEYGLTTSSSYSVFAEGDLALMDEKLVLTAGARYISENKKLARSVYSYLAEEYQLPPNSGGSRTDEDVIYRLGARFHFTGDVMAYFTTSTGFRSGGLSPRAQTPEVLASGYKPENLTNYELGLRTTFFDRRLQLNLTAFQMDYEDMQVELAVPSLDSEGNPVGTGTQLAIVNAGKAKVDGFELEAEWLALDWWRLSGNVGVLDAKYDELFVNIWGDQDSEGNLLPPQDESDLDMRRAPELTWTVTSVMDWNIGDGNLSWRASYSYTDDYEATITNYPGSAIESYEIFDSSISYSFGSWMLSVFGRNLTDEESWTHSYVVNPVRPTATDSAPGTLWRFAQRRAPREFGVELQYRF
ncbi:MAG TPA: TonB-dependent receptor [Steroidobacteraceae bacterium]|nr:TonB-dependent receptor [Steroidobacteraceae bacterium]